MPGMWKGTMKQNIECRLCMLGRDENRNTCIWGTGNKKAKVLLVGEAPGLDEDCSNAPFTGGSGRLLEHILNKLGVRREDLYITNVLKCRPPNNELPGRKETRECCAACMPYLVSEIERVGPKIAVVMGGTALEAMTGKTGITKYEGMVVSKDMIAAFHPAYVLRAPSKEIRLAQALARAFKLAGIKVKTKDYKEGGMYEYEVR